MEKHILITGGAGYIGSHSAKTFHQKGYKVILTTGRKESTRKITEEQLAKCGIFYDQLVMGVTGGERIIINDQKSDGTTTARAICPQRNEGIQDINI